MTGSISVVPGAGGGWLGEPGGHQPWSIVSKLSSVMKILSLDCSGGYMDAFIYQNLNCTLKMGAFYCVQIAPQYNKYLKP